jgi:hypothetical protein
MPLLTAAEQLAEVQAAITALLAGGQEVQLDGQRLKMADLAALTAREETLINRVARESRGTAGRRVSIGTGAGR